MKFSLQVVIALAATLAAATPAASPANSLLSKRQGNSGCYPFSDPDCGVNGSYCQCQNGCFYYEQADGSCQPPEGYIGCSEADLPGYDC